MSVRPLLSVRGALPSLRRALYSTEARPIRSILIANRGEIALRVTRTAAAHGIRTTTVYTEPDALSEHAHASPYSINLGPADAYLDGEKIIRIAKGEGCDAVHPGYGFLSENSKFAQRCAEEGIIFIGPPPSAIESMGNKSASKDIMTSAGVPCVPGYHGANQDPQFLAEQAQIIGYPVLIKAVKGGGGKGMRIATSAAEFPSMLESAKSESRSSFGDDTVLVERYITTPRHIEVQVFADNFGNCVALGERDCSIQRRHQKIIEESPAPLLDPEIRRDLWKKAREAALAVGYQGAGTVEFIFDNDTGEFFFMEMNTRLQVEHPVTEMVTGVDLVHWQVLVASGQRLPLTQEEVEAQLNGHAFEARIYAENPDKGFIPDSGKLLHLRTPPATPTVRIDSGFRQGDEITTFYDPMIAKLIVKGENREAALAKLRTALEDYHVAGPSTNIEFLKTLAEHPDFIAGNVETGFIPKHHDELFHVNETPAEVYAQAALSIFLSESTRPSAVDPFSVLGGGIGYTGGLQERVFLLQDPNSSKVVPVTLRQCGKDLYNLSAAGVELPSVRVVEDKVTGKLLGYYGHTRVESTVVRDDDKLFIFQHGKQFRLSIAQPAWLEKLGGPKDGANSVVAPMPCKVLRVDVQEGEAVKKDQALVVIESMKMETVIRSPQDGVVKKIVHGQGDVVKAGVTLVLFEEPGEGQEAAS
ncbi:3-methylcrotonyl-CoA carboxylase-like protein subunit alpha [Sphaerosporella brunnea]|uniref:3-methylcrotonyl-CoA carboxylase-like protein subunit alpha n=1 Tax=Sphaerosporella brunnea TaxID=1250544 RepID=A0A5J5F2Q1_9PEZI|nr:3-methylcrotonyl-CoA carboxylase-like protein subunit alpha [Sphaerosporella brunnea]